MDRPTQTEVLAQLAELNYVYSSESVGFQKAQECLGWFARHGISLVHRQNAYMLTYPYRRTLEQIHMDSPFNYGELAREAKLDIVIVVNMLSSVPVCKADAEVVLATLPQFIGGGPYNLDTVAVVLLPE